jgi:excisionase family DNA binding protein
MEEDKILTIKEVAEYLRIVEKTVYRLASERKIPGFKVGGSWRFRKSEIDEWIDKQSKKSKKD